MGSDIALADSAAQLGREVVFLTDSHTLVHWPYRFGSTAALNFPDPIDFLQVSSPLSLSVPPHLVHFYPRTVSSLSLTHPTRTHFYVHILFSRSIFDPSHPYPFLSSYPLLSISDPPHRTHFSIHALSSLFLTHPTRTHFHLHTLSSLSNPPHPCSVLSAHPLLSHCL